MLRMRARLAGMMRRREGARAGTTPSAGRLDEGAQDARVAAARARAWARRLAERARQERARTAIVAALLATEQAAARHAARAACAGPGSERSGGRPPLLH